MAATGHHARIRRLESVGAPLQKRNSHRHAQTTMATRGFAAWRTTRSAARDYIYTPGAAGMLWSVVWRASMPRRRRQRPLVARAARTEAGALILAGINEDRS